MNATRPEWISADQRIVDRCGWQHLWKLADELVPGFVARGMEFIPFSEWDNDEQWNKKKLVDSAEGNVHGCRCVAIPVLNAAGQPGIAFCMWKVTDGQHRCRGTLYSCDARMGRASGSLFQGDEK